MSLAPQAARGRPQTSDPAVTRNPRDFNAQADSFDARAGLPATACEAIAGHVSRLGGLEAGGLLLEIGAGPGQIGCFLCALPLRYAGFDASRAMLDVFARRCRESGRRPSLFLADGRAPWPVANGSVGTFFSSRAIHLLPAPHVVTQLSLAASRQGASVIVGRVHRGDSVRFRLRQQMRARLRRLGYAFDEARQPEHALLDACEARGGIRFQPVVAAAWPVTETPAAVIASWRTKSGLAGLDLPEQVKGAVLSDLETWAVAEFGALDIGHHALEQYVLEGLRLSGKHGS